MNFIKISIHIHHHDLETMSDYLFHLGSMGTEVIDSQVLEEEHVDHYGEIYDLKRQDYPETGVILIGYFDNSYEIDQLKNEILHVIANNGIELINDYLMCMQMEDVSYDDSWKEHHQEITINDTISIIPSWFECEEGKQSVRIEPGLGFGTGSHPTTRMCLVHLSHYIKQGDRVIDLGTGSGVIAILASLLTKSEVYGIDLDEDALKNARYNAKLNPVNQLVFSTDYTHITSKVDIMVVNIVYDIIIQLFDDIKTHLKPNGLCIISGIQLDNRQSMQRVLEQNNFTIIEEASEKDFISFVCQNNNNG